MRDDFCTITFPRSHYIPLFFQLIEKIVFFDSLFFSSFPDFDQKKSILFSIFAQCFFFSTTNNLEILSSFIDLPIVSKVKELAIFKDCSSHDCLSWKFQKNLVDQSLMKDTLLWTLIFCPIKSTFQKFSDHFPWADFKQIWFLSIIFHHFQMHLNFNHFSV